MTKFEELKGAAQNVTPDPAGGGRSLLEPPVPVMHGVYIVHADTIDESRGMVRIREFGKWLYISDVRLGPTSLELGE